MSLNFKKSGSGEPLVLVHGLFGSLENLGGIARLLQDQFTVYSVDLPNHGRSPHFSPTSLEQMSEEIGRWFDEQGLTHAHWLGHSLGGKVCMELALNRPDIVGRLVVVDIAPIKYGQHHDDVFAGLLSVDPAQLKSRSEADKIIAEHVPEIAVRSFLLKNLQKEGDGFVWRMNLHALHNHYLSLIKANRQDASFAGPTMFLKGGNSPYIGESQREDILSRFPNAQLKVVANTGHWLHAEKPEVVAKLVSKFLTSDA